MTLQSLYGVIPRVCGKGAAAHQVWDLVRRLSLEPRAAKHHSPVSHIDQLLLLDRNIDLLSPLTTQLTYEGLIDEMFGIQNSEHSSLYCPFDFWLLQIFLEYFDEICIKVG